MPFLENDCLKKRLSGLENCKEREEAVHLEQKQDQEDETITKDHSTRCSDEDNPHTNKAEEAMTKSAEDGGSFSSKVIGTVFIILLLDLLGFTLILPLLPSILDHYAQTGDVTYQSMQAVVDWFRELVGIPLEKKYNSVLFGGLTGSLFSLLQFLSSPVTGALSDHHGRRPLLILTTLGLMSSYAVWAVSRSFGMFLLFRVIGGICKGNISLCTAIVADLPCPRARNRGMVMIGIAFSLGFTVGPLMGAYVAVSSRTSGNVFFQTPALLALAFGVADLLFIWVMLPETLIKDNKVSSSGYGDSRDLLSPLSLFLFAAITRTKDPPSKEKMKKLQVLGLVYFCYLFLFSGLEFTLSFLTHQRFQFTSMQQGKMFFFIGVVMAVIQGGYARRIKPGQHISAVRLAMIILIPSFILIGLSRNITMLYVGLVLYSFAAAIVVPCLSTLVSDHGSANQKGTVMGILRSLGALARALGPVVSSSVYWIAGAQTCFLISSASFVIPLTLLSKTRRMKDE
ncbi:major facilitator superfamily domain-containing protein 10-like [Xenentodon cancila]